MQICKSFFQDRFLVEMKGRLRLDKVAQSIEHFLADSNRRASQKDDDDQGNSSSKSLSSNSFSLHGRTSGPLYFQVPQQHQETSAKELSEEMESAVPLSEVLIASSSSANLLPLRRNIHRCNTMPSSFLNQATSTPDSSVKKGSLGLSLVPGDTIPQEPESVERKRRPLVSREATNFPDSPEQQRMQTPPLEILMIPPRHVSSQSSCSMEDRVVPLIPFEELMLIETLGMGRVSTIYRSAWQKNRVDTESPMPRDVTMVALKVATINPHTGDSLHVDELRREANIATMLKHPNVCELVGIAADAECFCLAYEYCEGGSLLSLLSSNSRYYEYLPLALDIANGMAYLHSRQVIHRDLKPSNVLLTRDRRAKISDFGMSVANQGQELTAETGTYRYMAPEVIRHESYSSNADVYSFGILLWQLITR
jgi:Protein tyrosine and serine/threonine kinase